MIKVNRLVTFAYASYLILWTFAEIGQVIWLFASIFQFTSAFSDVFNHPAQEKHFAEYLTGLIASGNLTVADIHQRLICDTEYDSLHHFMTESPWSSDDIKAKRFEWIKNNLPTVEEKPIL